jgi:hypothetical protein
VDHVLPVATHPEPALELSNLRVIHYACNSACGGRFARARAKAKTKVVRGSYRQWVEPRGQSRNWLGPEGRLPDR